MNRKIKVVLAGLVAGSSLAIMGVFGASAGTQDALWEQMSTLREIMHFSTVTAEPVDQGVRVVVTSDRAQLAETIQQTFTQEGLNESFPPATTVSFKPVSDGVEIVFAAEEPEAIQTLQKYGAGLFYSLLRTRMHNTMVDSGYVKPGMGPGFGPGMHGPGMHGPGMGSGFGPGMHGPGMGSGFGPGMHGPGMGYGMGPGMHGSGMGNGWGGSDNLP